MLNKKIFKIATLTASLIVLTACSTARTAPVSDGANIGEGGNGGVQANGIGDGSSFGGSGGRRGCTLRVENQRYYFDFDRSEVNEADMASIKVQAHYLATHPHAHILLAGNTDDRGSREYNIGLGERRARSVEAILEADGVSKKQITTVSYGAEKPVASGQDEDAYAQNRRVDLVYQTPIG